MKILVALMAIILTSAAFSQEAPRAAGAGSQNVQSTSAEEVSTSVESGSTQRKVPPKTGKSSVVGWLSSFEFWMSFSVLSFGLLVFAIEIVMVRLTSFHPEQTIKLLAVTLIVISTLSIITAGFDSEQIAPAMGLFGTIAGYMLGRASGRSGEIQE